MNNLVIKNAKLRFRNFSGRQERFNPAGNRNFAVDLTEEQAEMLSNDGWNVKRWESKDSEREILYLPVTVRFSPVPPKIIQISMGNKVKLDEDTVGILDDAEIETADISIRPYSWETNGKTGIKAYLKTLYVTLKEDEFEKDYSEVPF